MLEGVEVAFWRACAGAFAATDRIATFRPMIDAAQTAASSPVSRRLRITGDGPFIVIDGSDRGE